jgi:hypothetical protein
MQRQTQHILHCDNEIKPRGPPIDLPITKDDTASFSAVTERRTRLTLKRENTRVVTLSRYTEHEYTLS